MCNTFIYCMIELAKVIVKEVRPELRNSKSKSLLDYGSGTGLVSLELPVLVDSVLLVDSSRQVLEVTEAKIALKEINNSRVYQADFIEKTPEFKADTILIVIRLKKRWNYIRSHFADYLYSG